MQLDIDPHSLRLKRFERVLYTPLVRSPQVLFDGNTTLSPFCKLYSQACRYRISSARKAT